MKKQGLLIILAFTIGLTAFSQENEPKMGWNFGVLPALGFDSNLGLMYGGIVNLFDYGDGSRFPDYDHSLYLQLSAYTRGSMDAIAFFDSYSLIPEKHFIGRFSYNRNRTYPFYGFNGAQTIYNSNFETNGADDFISQVFYRLDRGQTKVDVLVEDKIADSKFNWIAGLDLGWYQISTVDIDHLKRKKEGDDILPDANLLYDHFVEWGLIDQNVKDGGFDNSIKVGVAYDSRDRLTNPMRGMWTEILFRGAPKFFGNPTNFARIAFTHRQYFTLVEEKLSFAYRLWYEGNFGDVPFYSRQHLTTRDCIEGFGGVKTVRGVLMNRVVGRHTAIGNFELRWKAFRFNAIGQNFYVGLNAFADAGSVLQGYNLDLSSVPQAIQDRFFADESNELFYTIGGGLKLVMNENFVVSADYGLAMDKNYGTSGMYIAIGYLF
ncbi:Omp85 family outer membrane protein [Perlabentimonas gracilis]|uniref:Omp85 family outer membrane protein n=1 Tax=Perlabentimonas gracilis TaxID=2715279 RepID=UPI00140BD83D|nr:BamA/TamA family outer membrane protein [Perlabentimonas gracilis]NHB69740.1 BamA/TamA family outer membrane protein [Perlabentimonas gracilis]